MRDRLTAFLYALMMKENVAPGTFERVMESIEKEGFDPDYEHEGLAGYATKLALRLVPKLPRNTEAARATRGRHCD